MARPIAGRLLSAPLLVCVLLGALSPATLRAEPAAGVSAGLYANMVPDLTYLTPMAAITRGKLYAEGRYQYEDLETGSAWFGRIFEGETGDDFTWWLAPVAGGVFGRTRGFAPGVNFDVAWRQFSVAGSAEYVFDLKDSDASFFYSWTEWLYTPRPPFAAGITIERNRQRVLAGDVNAALTAYTGYRDATLSFYAFNVWDSDDDFYVVGLGADF